MRPFVAFFVWHYEKPEWLNLLHTWVPVAHQPQVRIDILCTMIPGTFVGMDSHGGRDAGNSYALRVPRVYAGKAREPPAKKRFVVVRTKP